ncbi:MAG: rhodanese-like domain-containing protein [Planctomycetota bacterium]
MITHFRVLLAPSALLSALLVASLGCDIKTSDRDLVFLDPPSAVEKMHPRTGMFEKAVVACWVDPRSADEYAKGHISGAISAPLVEMQETVVPRFAGHNLFVVYGDAFQDALAKAGAKRLLELGFKNVYVLEGGIRAWQKDGYTLVTGTEPGGGTPPKKDGAGIKPAERGGVEVPEQGVR